MKTIKQKNPGDCAVCAMAMFLGLSYKELIERASFVCSKIGKVKGGGLDKNEMLLIIGLLSKRPPILVKVYPSKDNERREELFKIIENKKAILSALSLNHIGVGHAVYWDGKEVHDPSRKLTYTKDSINPYEIIM